MNERIKSNLTNAYLMFILDFADPSSLDKAKMEEEIKCKIEDVFKAQKTADRAKRILKARFASLLALYFSQFSGKSGLDYVRLDEEILKNKKHLLRHLGKDKVAYIQLVVGLMKSLDQGQPKKGLLMGAAS